MSLTHLIPMRLTRGSILDRPAGALGCYLGLTLLMTFPLALSWRSSLPAGAGDLWQNYWNFWWWKQCLLEGLNPLQTQFLFHPFGADLVFHTHSPFNQIVAMPVNLAFGEAAAYNFCVVLALTLSGFGGYLLVKELTGSVDSAFLAGLVFAYFPQTVEQTLEHVNLFSAQFIPVSLFYLLRWTRSGRRADMLASGTCFGLNALCSWHLGLKLAILMVPWIAWHIWRNRNRAKRIATDLGCGAAIATLLVLPMLAPMVTLMAEGAEYYLKAPVARGIDPTYLLTPSYENPIFGQLVQDRYLDRAYQAAGFLCFLGFVPLLLASVGVWRGRRQAYPWLAVFVLGVVLALGAQPFWDGTLHESIALPFAALSWFPLLENLRVANRFMLVASVGLAVLVGYGWRSLRVRPTWVLPLVTVLLLAEYSWLPFPMQEIGRSPLLERVAMRPGAVLDIPFHQRNRSVHNMVAQTVHGKPISGGYLSSYPPEVGEAVSGDPALAQLAGVPGATVRVDVDRLRELGFRTVVIHKYRIESVRDSMLSSVQTGKLLERKRVLRLGGIPDEVMASIRAQLDAAVGGAALEDNLLAVYGL